MYLYKLEIAIIMGLPLLDSNHPHYPKYYTTVDYHKWYRWNALCTIISVKEICLMSHIFIDMKLKCPWSQEQTRDELTQYYIAFSSFRKLLFFHKFATHDNTVCVMNWWKCAEAPHPMHTHLFYCLKGILKSLGYFCSNGGKQGFIKYSTVNYFY